MTRIRILERTELDLTMSVLGILASLALIAYLVFRSNRLIYVLIGVLTLLFCALWLILRRDAAFPAGVFLSRLQHPYPSGAFRVLVLAYIALFVASLLQIHLRAGVYERPLGYFILVSAMAGVLAMEILYTSPRGVPLVLLQIISLGLSLAWTQLLIFPSVLGVDPWWHQAFTELMLELHSIPLSLTYTHLPLFHLEIASMSMIGDIGYKLAAMLSVSLVQIVCLTLFTYLIGRALFGSRMVGLLASLVLIVANQEIYMSYWSIPNAFSAVFILVVIYLLFKLKETSPVRSLHLSLLIMAAIILSHSMTAVFLALVLFICLAAFWWENHGEGLSRYPVNLILVIQFTVGLLAWWRYISGHLWILSDILQTGFSQDYFIQVPTQVQAYILGVPLPEQFFNNAGMFLYFAGSLIGVFYMFRYGNRYGFALAANGLVVLALGFLPMIAGMSLVEHRWWFFSQIMLAIPLAVSILIFTARAGGEFRSLFLWTGISALAFLMVMSPNANVDNPAFSPTSAVRAALTESELRATETVLEMTDEPIGTDVYTCIQEDLAGRPHLRPIHEALVSGHYRPVEERLILIRSHILGSPFPCYDGVYRLTHDPRENLEREGFGKIYDSNGAALFNRV
ncbi:MAG: hypothetical protein QMD46_13315 [Methanomicrobiales archaeon]|nr:hypothetical protein [Methanomicrobiales archaeon]MDI6877545.1 hypothetical protein [Methanomicrobiales archaeon]